MTATRLYASVTGTSDIESITVTDSHVAPTSTATITALDTSLGIGSSITVNLGFTGNHQRVFQGYVKNIEHRIAPEEYIITASNKMVRAMDYFLVSDNPKTPFTRNHIKAETLVKQLMAIAGLTNYSGQNSQFTFGINTNVTVNLTSIYDYCKFIADIIAFHLYADNDGKIHFLSRPPYPQGGDPSVATINESSIINNTYSESDRDLRNRVVVYGANGIYATAQASSPYLPGGFYKSIAVSAPGVIDTTSMAQKSANYNLALFNKLTIGGQATILGNPALEARQCITLSGNRISELNRKWYIYGCEHSWSKSGYVTSLDLRG
jgi:hypothetical protein